MTRVVTFGTFDIFHPGHVSYLKQAKKLGDYLLVVVARDTNTHKAKGMLPENSESARVRKVRKAKIANKVILGSKTRNFYRTLRTNKIDLIALGYDQKPTVYQLRKALKSHRLANIEIKRLRAHRPDEFKSSKLSKQNYVK